MADIRNMTLESVLASDAATVNAAVEWVVFGDPLTAESQELIAMAASEMRGSDGQGNATFDWWTEPIRLGPGYGYGFEGSGNHGHGLWLWDHREGQPWRESLEAHVAAYRHPARDFLGDWNECMRIVERLRELAESNGKPEHWAGWCKSPFLKFVQLLGVTKYPPAGECFWHLTRDSVVHAALRATWRPAQETP